MSILYYLIVLSLSSETTPGITLENYRFVLLSEDFVTAFKNTFLFVLAGTPLELIFGLILALIVWKSFPGRGFVRSIFIIPLAIPTIVTATILFILFNYPTGHINDLFTGRFDFFPVIFNAPINWRNNPLLAMGVSMFGKVWRDMPISMLILLAGLNAIDRRQYDAAETMGAGTLTKFRYITLPCILPAVGTVILMRSIEMWKEFIFPFILAPSYLLLGTYIEYLDRRNFPERASVVALILLVCVLFSSILSYVILKQLRSRLFRI
ncbi:MAG: sugar ABC transporter permease [bacterium]